MKRVSARPLTEEDYHRAAAEYLASLPLEHFMEATPQSTQRRVTLGSFDHLRVFRPDVHLFNELLVQYPLGDGLGQVVPDNMALISEQPIRDTGSFNLPFESVQPLLVMEYVSLYSQRKDYKDSLRKYEEQLKVPYCLMFYPEKQDLRVYRHARGRYQKMKPNAAGRYPIPELDLEAGLLHGWVRFWYKGRLLELSSELQLQLDAEKQRADQEKQRADQEKQRADQEKQRADAAEAELERLRALLGQQGGKKPRAKGNG
ncbi:MAG TPA: Uma2 family endonuclease [Gemmataceae bacterium]|nr:Uma2 family endonuclease [Gemmataceae bacterium]